MDSIKVGNLKVNVNFNKDAKRFKELEQVEDSTMETFHRLVESALSKTNNFRTDNNSPLHATKTYYVCADTIPYLIKILEENPNFFRMENIGTVRILSNVDYDAMLRKKYHIDEMGQTYIENKIPLLKHLVESDDERNEKAREIVRTNTGNYMTVGDAIKKGLKRD